MGLLPVQTAASSTGPSEIEIRKWPLATAEFCSSYLGRSGLLLLPGLELPSLNHFQLVRPSPFASLRGTFSACRLLYSRVADPRGNWGLPPAS